MIKPWFVTDQQDIFYIPILFSKLKDKTGSVNINGKNRYFIFTKDYIYLILSYLKDNEIYDNNIPKQINGKSRF